MITVERLAFLLILMCITVYRKESEFNSEVIIKIGLCLPTLSKIL